MAEKHEFCSQCGVAVEEADKYCCKCSHKLKDSSENIERHDSERKITYKEFLIKKKDEQRSFFNKNKSKNKDKTPEYVTINVGIISENEGGKLRKERGSKISVTVSKDADAKAVLNAAITKLSNHNQYFCGMEKYTLCYPDFSPIYYIPGSSKPFTVAEYKRELGKPFSKVDLFVCLTSTILRRNLADGDSDDNGNHNITSAIAYKTLSETSLNVTTRPDDVPSASNDINYHETTAEQDNDGSMDDSCELPPLYPELGFSQLDNTMRASSYCPICNKKFEIEIIESHVELCIANSQTPFIALQNSIADELEVNVSQQYYHDIDDDEILPAKKKSLPEERSSFLDIIKLEIANSFILSTEDHFNINIRRGFELSDFLKFFTKPWNKKKIGNEIKISYLGEAGADTGGVSREFYREAFEQVKTQFFNGNDAYGLEPAFGLVSVTDGTLYGVGHLLVASLVHHGPGPGFLAPWVYHFIAGGVDAINLPSDGNVSEVYERLQKEAFSDEELRNILNTDVGLEAMEAIGYRGNPASVKIEEKDTILRSIFIKEKLQMVIPGLNQLSSGMENYNALNAIKCNIEAFLPVFCPSEMFTWDYELLYEKLQPFYSEDGSNNKRKEIDTFKVFLDFIEACFKDDSCSLSPKQLMKYLTGSHAISPLGLPPNIKVSFKHDCQPSQSGTQCRCLPVVSTCAMSIVLPVHINTDELMLNAFSTSIAEGQGFQRC